jgi:hypothetical protein
MCDERGVVTVGEDKNEGYWFSDGYGDYIRHFLVAMAAVPEWAPPGESHVLRSTSVVTHVDYAPGRTEWSTFDADAVETLRLPGRPTAVSVAGASLEERADLDAEGYVVHLLASGDAVVLVRHIAGGPVVVENDARTPAGQSPEPGDPDEPSLPAGCSVARGGPR